MRKPWKPRQPSVYDERERLALAEAGMLALQILTAIILAVFLYAWLAIRWDWWLPGPDDLGACFHLFLVTTVPLPVIIAEWRTPLPPEDEEE